MSTAIFDQEIAEKKCPGCGKMYKSPFCPKCGKCERCHDIIEGILQCRN
jgi:endogenous inhibitor of DNA gyrase (YacG/DUF329 family)